MQEHLELDVVESGGDSVLPVRKAHVRQQRVFRESGGETLLVSDLSALVPAGDPCLFIRKGLEAIDLSDLRELYKDHGGIAYDPLPMLGILLYAYFEGESGSRTIEKRCRRDVCYMYVGRGLKPDDRTIRRFRRRIGPRLDEVFKRIVLACKDSGLLPMRLIAVDGTKMASAGSQITRWLKTAEKADVAEMGFEPPECSDPDARSVKASKGFILGYNCQASVDCDSGIVPAIYVTNVGSDGRMLSPMVQEVVANVGETPSEIVADAGYDTSESVQACAEQGITPIVALKDKSILFWTLTQEDEIVCPMGKPALPSGNGDERTPGKTYHVLRVVGCAQCPMFKECCPNSSARTLSFPEGVDPVHRINAAYRARSPVGRQAMQERMAKIEPVFADIKSNKGLNRFKLRGLQGVRIEWSLIHMARNLKKLGEALQALILAYCLALRAIWDQKFISKYQPNNSIQIVA